MPVAGNHQSNNHNAQLNWNQSPSSMQQHNQELRTETLSRQPALGFKTIINEMKAKQFDSIRFAAYRTASKLRFIQQRTHFVFLDIWNVVEAFRQSGLHTIEASTQLERCRIEETISVMYSQLNMRLPATRQINLAESTALLLAWLLHSYDTTGLNQMRVLALKVALSTLASGKPIDKFRYHFTLISDPSGALVPLKFEQYLNDLLLLAVGVFEGPNFAYDHNSSKFMLTGRARNIVLEEFLNRMLTDPGPQCLLWLTIFHRMAHVQNVKHSVKCEVCRWENIVGFRYKCQRCHNYNLCQVCFWTGAVSGNHTIQHDVKEYTSSKSHSRQFGHSLRKSFGKQNNNSRAFDPSKSAFPSMARRPQFSNTPMGTLDRKPGEIAQGTPPTVRMMTHLQPLTNSQTNMMSSCSQPSMQNVLIQDHRGSPAPMLMGGAVSSAGSTGNHFYGNDCNSHPQQPAPRRPNSFTYDPNRIDDEHRLIARYAARLAADNKGDLMNSKNEILPLPDVSINWPIEATKMQKDLIMQLEVKNREILKEIQRLRVEQAATAAANGGMISPSAGGNPTLLGELRALRQRKEELEMRMMNLQESRKELMSQLGSLMNILKTDSNSVSAGGSTSALPTANNGSLGMLNMGSPANTATGSLKASYLTGMQPQMISSAGGMRSRMGPRHSTSSLQEGNSNSYLAPVTTYSQNSDGQGRTTIRHDLLMAADSVTHAMSSLVRELNSETVSEDAGRSDCVIGQTRGVAVIAAPINNQSRGNNHQNAASNEYEAKYEKALESNSSGHGSRGNATSDVEFVTQQQAATEQRFLDELQARRVHPESSGNHLMSNSAGYSRKKGGAYNNQDSESDAYLYSDPEYGGAMTDTESGDHRSKSAVRSRHYATDVETDQESFIRTDDEDGGNTEWEENMRRWNNR